MLRRISLIAASAAMLAFSALPASAATMQSSTAPAVVTHKLTFPHPVHGITTWGTYIKTPKFVRLNICSIDTARANWAVGAVAIGTNAKNTARGNLGAVAIGFKQKVCRSGLVRYTAHLYTYTFIANNHGRIVKRSALKKIY
jgi:hypothetical protein